MAILRNNILDTDEHLCYNRGMKTQNDFGRTLREAIVYFSDPDVCVEFVAKMRWENGAICPRCGSGKNNYIKTRRIWQCKNCKRQFSVKVGTIFEDSPIPLEKWLPAVWMIVNAKNGVSSYEIARGLGVTQKTAWFMLHRIRLAMQDGSVEKLSGEVEVDETYVGGKAENMHKGKRPNFKEGETNKAIVIGLLERGGKVRTKVVEDTSRYTLQNAVKANVAQGAKLFTDKHQGYDKLKSEYKHQAIDHAEKFVDGEIHISGIENFWALFKRCIKGTYVSVDHAHLHRYLGEEGYRYNQRLDNDAGRFAGVVRSVSGKRLTYRGLIRGS